MAGYVTNIEDRTILNESFREVLFTSGRLQLVVMALRVGEEIGLETHDDVDQFIRVEAGSGMGRRSRFRPAPRTTSKTSRRPSR